MPPYENTPLFTQAVVLLNHIPQKDAEKLLDVTVYTDETVAREDLAKGKLSAVVVFPSAISNDHAVRLYVDSSNTIIPPLVESAVRSVLALLGADNPVIVYKIYGDITYLSSLRRCDHDGNFYLHNVRGGIALIKDREAGIHEGYSSPRATHQHHRGIISSGTVRAFIAGFTIS